MKSQGSHLQPMRRIQRIHFVGIGGAGMSGIAEVLVNQGFQVSGSDLAESRTTRRLQQLGASLFKGHESRNVEGADVLVVSSAIADDNPELAAARELRIPIVPRAEMLAELMRFFIDEADVRGALYDLEKKGHGIRLAGPGDADGTGGGQGRA